MPIYEFECSACGDQFERLQKLADPDPTVCPKCGAPRVKRRLTAPAFRLAGKGWYETDFKKEGDRKRNLAGGEDAPKTEAKSDDAAAKKPDTTPAEKKDTAPVSAPKAKPEGTASA